MKITRIFVLVLLISFVFTSQTLFPHERATIPTDKRQISNQEKLVVLWTSGDRDLAIKMAFMYTYNAKKNEWWDDITLIVWGPSSKLLSHDKELQDYIKKMKDKGIILKACKACSDMYGVSEQLEDLGVEVKYMGVEFTNYIKEGRHILTL